MGAPAVQKFHGLSFNWETRAATMTLVTDAGHIRRVELDKKELVQLLANAARALNVWENRP